MSNIVFCAISPHPPLILPNIGSAEDRQKVKKTIESLELLGGKLKESKPDSIIISSPHQDWGFNVPLYFLAPNFSGEIKHYLTGIDRPEFYFKEGRRIYGNLDKNKKYAIISSGDMSHCLKEDGPYGFNEEGPKFDKDFIKYLKDKDIGKISELEDDYPGAGECGLRSFCFALGIIEAANINWETEVLSYEGPFGVGYLVVNFKLNK
jgi:aromatic ring-opening dioxygenase LigB subunit